MNGQKNADRSKSLESRRLRNKIHEKIRTWKGYGEIWQAKCMPKTDGCSEKTWGDSRLAPLADPCNQEVKAKAAF